MSIILKELVLIFSLLPYLYVFFSNYFMEKRIISFIIFFNGVLCHGTSMVYFKYKIYFIRFDILSNILLTIYINYYTLWQPYTSLITVTMATGWIINRGFKCTWYTVFRHALFIQGSAFMALINFNY